MSSNVEHLVFVCACVRDTAGIKVRERGEERIKRKGRRKKRKEAGSHFYTSSSSSSSSFSLPCPSFRVC